MFQQANKQQKYIQFQQKNNAIIPKTNKFEIILNNFKSYYQYPLHPFLFIIKN